MAFTDEHTDAFTLSWIKHLANQPRSASTPLTSGRLLVQLYGQKVHGMASLPNELGRQVSVSSRELAYLPVTCHLPHVISFARTKSFRRYPCGTDHRSIGLPSAGSR
jgi:hypothetical protein